WHTERRAWSGGAVPSFASVGGGITGLSAWGVGAASSFARAGVGMTERCAWSGGAAPSFALAVPEPPPSLARAGVGMTERCAWSGGAAPSFALALPEQPPSFARAGVGSPSAAYGAVEQRRALRLLCRSSRRALRVLALDHRALRMERWNSAGLCARWRWRHRALHAGRGRRAELGACRAGAAWGGGGVGQG